MLCEGYTDVIALHQAGLRNTVGLMGTALTEDQVGELARLAPVVLLALDADSAGQEAMLRAAKVAAGRRLELRVVVLPTGQDPADLLLSEGPDGMRERVAASVPFVRFRVDRVLASEDLRSAEGKDRAVEELRPVLGPLRGERAARRAARACRRPARRRAGEARGVARAAAARPGAAAGDAPRRAGRSRRRRRAGARAGARAHDRQPVGARRALVPRPVPRAAAGGPRGARHARPRAGHPHAGLPPRRGCS